MAERGEVITLLDEEGKTHEFNLVDVIELESKRYAILQPANQEEEAVVLRVEDDTLVAIEDEEEFDRVVEAIQESAEYDEVKLLDNEDSDDAGDEDDDSKHDESGRVM